MIVGFILKNRGSLNHTLMPPKTMISTAVTTCIRDRCPVSHHSTPIASRNTGMNPAVTTINPSYSVPPKVKIRSLSIRYAAKNAMIGPSSRPVFTNGLIFFSLMSAPLVTCPSASVQARGITSRDLHRCRQVLIFHLSQPPAQSMAYGHGTVPQGVSGSAGGPARCSALGIMLDCHNDRIRRRGRYVRPRARHNNRRAFRHLCRSLATGVGDTADRGGPAGRRDRTGTRAAAKTRGSAYAYACGDGRLPVHPRQPATRRPALWRTRRPAHRSIT